MILFNGHNVILSTFPNAEKQYIDLSKFLNFTSNTFTLVFEGNQDIFDLMLIKKCYDDINLTNAEANLEMKFCPYGQMDRKIPDCLFSFKYFAQLINSLNFNSVLIYDPHSTVIECSINRAIIDYPMSRVKSDKYDLFFYPDNGAAKKYSEIYNKPYRYGNKKRDLNTGKIICYEVIADKEDINGKNILIRDDLIIRGGTYKYAAQALKDMGAKQVDLYITHIMPSAEDFCENYKEYGIDNFYSDNTLKVQFFKDNSAKLF